MWRISEESVAGIGINGVMSKISVWRRINISQHGEKAIA